MDVDQIPNHPERFVEVLRGILGVSGAPLLRFIVAELRAVKLANEEEQRLVDRFASVLEEGRKSLEAGVE
jgi:hypothetical protein